MKQKSSTIETNAQKYLNYIPQNKKITIKEKIYFYIIINNNLNNNNTIPLFNELNEGKNN